ncbi:MAG: hypothetical protein E3K36_11495 [Candidatus Brocadia sp.]|nr:hypothetical protein [Candidatus Brocadia sp.]
MSYTIILKSSKRVTRLPEKLMQLFASLHTFKETHKSFFMKCAVLFMSVKVALILLATFTTMAVLLSSATQYLAIELSKTKAILFASSLTMIIMAKLYFIVKILMTYDRSKSMIKAMVSVILLKGRQGIRRIEETIPAYLSPFSLEKVRNR